MCEITEDGIVGYMMHGLNRDDEDFTFGGIVREAHLLDGRVPLAFNLRDGAGDLTEIRVALQAQKKCEPGGGFALCSRGAPSAKPAGLSPPFTTGPCPFVWSAPHGSSRIYASRKSG